MDLPDRDLLRIHAALAGILYRSGTDNLFEPYLIFHLPWVYCGAGRSVYPGSTGGGFWKSIVAYEGPEVCLEVELWEATEALRDAANASPHAPQ